MNPKEEFLERLQVIIKEFENKTGVVLLNIRLDRWTLSQFGIKKESSTINSINLELK